MWQEGNLLINETVLHYCVKHYDEPSEDYGIDGGRISKLEIRPRGGQATCRYDRGWDLEPEDEESQLALLVLLKRYN